MAGTVTVSETVTGSLTRIIFTWTASSGGAADGVTAGTYTGEVIYAAFTPGATTPTTAYDVVITKTGAVDVLAGTGANLISTATVYKDDLDGLTSVTASTLTLAVTNAGNATNGTITLFLIASWNPYCSYAQVKDRLSSAGISVNAIDDGILYDMMEQGSRAIDAFCGGRTFYARTETHYFDIPADDQLDVDDDLLTVTTLTNGDDTTIASTAYYLLNRNHPPYYALRLRASSGITWLVDTNGESTQVIELAGTWGYVSRTATDARSIRIIRLTESAALDIVAHEYRRRFGENTTSTTIVTASGVVITPEGFPQSVKDKLAPLRRVT